MTKAHFAPRSGRLNVSAALVALLAIGTCACAKLEARDDLNKGVREFKAEQYDKAIEWFKEAKKLDPTLLTARLYLAAAYASVYKPGSPKPENLNMGNQAVAEFRDVLRIDPKNISAIDGIGSILFYMGGQPYDPAKLEESRSFHLKHIELRPDDPEPYNWVGIIDWGLAYHANVEMRDEYKRANPRKPVKDTDPLPAKLREDFTAKYGEVVDDGIARLKKAVELRPDYDDAIANLNLLYRQKADQVESGEDREKYLADADALIEKVKEIKQKKAEKAGPTG